MVILHDIDPAHIESHEVVLRRTIELHESQFGPVPDNAVRRFRIGALGRAQGVGGIDVRLVPEAETAILVKNGSEVVPHGSLPRLVRHHDGVPAVFIHLVEQTDQIL